MPLRGGHPERSKVKSKDPDEAISILIKRLLRHLGLDARRLDQRLLAMKGENNETTHHQLR